MDLELLPLGKFDVILGKWNFMDLMLILVHGS
jgi:hypothetical protein